MISFRSHAITSNGAVVDLRASAVKRRPDHDAEVTRAEYQWAKGEFNGHSNALY